MPTSAIEALEGRQLFAALTAGQTVTTSVTTSSTTKNWTIPLRAGQAYAVAVGDTGTSSFATELIILGPDGKTVTTTSGDRGAFVSRTAFVSGNYTVRVRDVGQNQSATVRVTAFYTSSQSVVDSDDAYTAQSGRRTPATIQPGDLDVWKINGRAGQFLSVVATENTANSALDVGVLLVGPDGKAITTKTSEKGIKIDQASIKTGSYYAVVFESGANDTGRYGISFGQTPGTQYSGDPDTNTPLSSGKTRNGDLPGGDIDVWQVSAAKGKRISLTLARTTGSLDPELLLIDPTGRVVASANGSSTTSLSYITQTSGTFSILARDREADDGGFYKLTYTLK